MSRDQRALPFCGGSAREPNQRRTAEVFGDHLSLRSQRDIEADLSRNYAVDVSVLTSSGVLRGHEGIRQTASRLADHCGDAPYEYLHEVVDGDFAYLVWQVRTHDRWIHGADSFRIRGGKIVLQTIHYVVIDAIAE